MVDVVLLPSLAAAVVVVVEAVAVVVMLDDSGMAVECPFIGSKGALDTYLGQWRQYPGQNSTYS